MALVATVTLRRGRYEAGGRDDRGPEIVPSPFRLFCALVAVAGREGDPQDNRALTWLESQPLPIVLRPPVLDQASDHGFFVTNRVSAKGGSTTHPGRVNGAKHRAWVSFRGDQFHFVWEQAPDGTTLEQLNTLAGGIGYLGRVESTATVRFATVDGPPSEGLDRFEPVRLDDGGVPVAVPFQGAVRQLVDAHERGDRAWGVALWQDYAVPQPHEGGPAQGPFDELVVFQIVGRAVDGSHLLRLTSDFRAAVMSRVKDLTGEDAIPAAIHGHDRSTPHVAYLALPHAGYDKADGRIRGVAVALPRTLRGGERDTVLRALLGHPDGAFNELSYRHARSRVLTIEHVPPTESRLSLLRSSRWTAPPNKGALTWTTVSPAMLDRHPKSVDGYARILLEGIVTAGYPEPERVEWSPAPLVQGAITYGRTDELIRRRQARPLVHARITFSEPLVGPVAIGALRYVGGGLCVPAPDERTDRAAKASEAGSTQP